MDIGPVRHPSPGNEAHRKGPEPRTATTPIGQQPPQDRVDISVEARRKLAELAEKAKAEEALNQETSPDQNGGTLDENLISLGRAVSKDEIRQRIEAGYYNRADVISKIADRLSDEFES